VLLLVVVLVTVLFSLARRAKWSIALRLAAWWTRVRPSVHRYIRSSPLTFAYLVVLSVTTVVVVSSSQAVATLLLREHSTNLHQLLRNPLRSLVLSAFWAPNYEFLVWTILFALVLAPAERWLGSRRLALVFATGHIGATLGVAWALWLAIRHGYAARHLENAIDVGVSYGFAAVAALFSFRLPRRWRGAWVAVLVAITVTALVVGRTFTDAGHLLAVVIGFACYPFTRAPAVRSRTAQPIWSVSTNPVGDASP
jgi:hypothetical protein